MSHPNGPRLIRMSSVAWVMGSCVVLAMLVSGGRIHAQTNRPSAAPTGGSPGPAADSCGVPAGAPPSAPAGGRGQPPVFPAGQYPVQLPAVSLLGARNDLPNPFRAGVDWGQLPPGRTWGSTASITTAPDGTIWVVDRCGNSGAGGTTCGGASASVNPIFQLDTSGKVLKNFGAGMFVSPHKLTVDKDGFLWLADNGSHQVFKLSQDGKVLMTLGKARRRGPGPRRVRRADRSRRSPPTATSSSAMDIPEAARRRATRGS